MSKQVQSMNNQPVKIGIVGLTHTHVHWILGRADRGDIEIVGIVEPNRDLAKRYADQHGYSMDIVFDTMDVMITATKPTAVTAFGSIYEHLQVVKKCAPLGIHVMVEKPLAVSWDHAVQMKMYAEKYGIHLMTNYETTWYPTHHEALSLIQENQIGELRKIVVHDGHKGPIKIGVNQEFLDWLTDPKQNGAGALTDFGCYGANLVTWLMNNKKPIAVTAVTQKMQPELYPKVKDEATIILEYPRMQAIIQASWNWPFARKDIEIYGNEGYIICDTHSNMRIRIQEDKDEENLVLDDRPVPFDDPFAYFAAVITKQIQPIPNNLSSLENNMIVMEILQAAMKSVETGKRIELH